MNIKIIGIGNTLMEDDGIGVYAAERIKKKISNKKDIEVITGETDFEYCISKINEGDFIFILDASYYGKNPSELTVFKLKDYRPKKSYITQHSLSLIDMLHLYYKNVQGYIIGIEIGRIDYKIGMSSELKSRFDRICDDILKFIFLKIDCKCKGEGMKLGY